MFWLFLYWHSFHLVFPPKFISDSPSLCVISYLHITSTWGQFSSVSHSIVSNSLRPRGLQLARLPCPSPTPGAYSNSCPSSWWCHPTISSSVVPFSSCPQSFPAPGSFPRSWFFASGGQGIGVSASASVLPMNIQDWFPLGMTGWISLQFRGLSRVFSNTTVQKHQFFGSSILLTTWGQEIRKDRRRALVHVVENF